MAKYTLQTFFIARNKKHTTACTYIQSTNYRQTGAGHVAMPTSVNLHGPTRLIHELYNTVSYRENALRLNMEQRFLGTNYPFLQNKCAKYATYIQIQLSCHQNTFYFTICTTIGWVLTSKMIYFTATL